ncbi:hypothetical protein LUZ60_010620 [Juncus effusus]|nr:hypothetical protein LUZ60_010620 [Juncus effusus]
MSVVDISLDSINRVKNLFFTKTMQKCTTFEIITAMIFKSHVKAINLARKDKVSLFYAANTRRLLHGIFPSAEGYYGNCVYGVEIVKTTEEINNASLIEVVTLVKGSKEVFSTEFMDWINGKLERHSMKQEYGRLFISDWRRIGLNEVNYGWGEPKYVFPHSDVVGADGYAYATVVNPPVPNQGVRLILRCLEEGQLTEFYRELEKIQTM